MATRLIVLGMMVLGWGAAVSWGPGILQAADPATAPLLSEALPAESLPPESLRGALARWAPRGAVAVALDGEVEWVHGGGRQYVPASILKLATALTALELLGPDYRFRTDIYRGRDGSLYLRGFGDPHLVSEEWRFIGEALAASGAFAQPFTDVVVDTGAMEPASAVDGRGSSLNPYDARLGALVSNFNTVLLEVGADRGVASAEPQTPLTPLARELGSRLRPGVQRVNLSRILGQAEQYTGELAREIFREFGGHFSGGVRTGSTPGEAQLLLMHRSSHTLRDVVRDMMAYSNNFIANQLLLVADLERGPRGAQSGAQSAGTVPANLKRGTGLLEQYLGNQLGLVRGSFQVVEGSGLSRQNRITPRGMLRIVEAFYPWRDLLAPYPDAAATVQAPAKTGSLRGISTLAGFLPPPAEHPTARRSFVILLEGSGAARLQLFDALMGEYSK